MKGNELLLISGGGDPDLNPADKPTIMHVLLTASVIREQYQFMQADYTQQCGNPPQTRFQSLKSLWISLFKM